MKASISKIVLLALACAGVDGRANLGVRNGGSSFCSAVNKIVTSAHQAPAATSFCSSYLSISQSTAIVTVATTSSITCAVPTEAAIVPRDVDINEPRNAGKKPSPKPSCFNTYTKTAILSSACSCLSIPSGTTTTTTTTASYIAATPATFKIVAQSSNSNVNGQYLRLRNSIDYVETFQGGSGTGGIFSLDATNNLFTHDVTGLARYADHAPSNADYVFFDDQATIAASGYELLSCHLTANSDQTCNLVCTDPEGRAYNSVALNGGDTQNEWAGDAGDTPIVPQIVPLS